MRRSWSAEELELLGGAAIFAISARSWRLVSKLELLGAGVRWGKARDVGGPDGGDG